MNGAFEKDPSVYVILGKHEDRRQRDLQLGGNAMAQIRNDVKGRLAGSVGTACDLDLGVASSSLTLGVEVT